MRNSPPLLWVVLFLLLPVPLACTSVELRPETTPARIRVDGQLVLIELAARRAARRQGLQFRRRPAVDRPLLVFYPEPGRPEFRAFDLTFAVDVAFVGLDGAVLQVARLRPGTEDVATSPADSRIAILAAADRLRHIGLLPTSRVELPEATRNAARQAWQKDRDDDERERRDWGWPAPEEDG